MIRLRAFSQCLQSSARLSSFSNATSTRCCTARAESSREQAAAPDDASGLKEGHKLSMAGCFSKDDLLRYSELSRDSNPIHTESAYAQAAGFPQCVVHGMLTAGLFPAIIGSKYAGAVYISQTLRFHEPALVGDRIVAEVTVKESVKLKRHYKVTFATSCFKEPSNTVIVDGIAVALLPAK